MKRGWVQTLARSCTLYLLSLLQLTLLFWWRGASSSAPPCPRPSACWSPWAGRRWTPAWTPAHPCGSRNRLCGTNGRSDPAGASPGPQTSWRHGSGPGRRWGGGAVRRLKATWGFFFLMKRMASNLFYLLLAAFTRAAVWFGVFHCKFIQCFFSFGTSLRVTLSCSDEICTEAANVLVAVYILFANETSGAWPPPPTDPPLSMAFFTFSWSSQRRSEKPPMSPVDWAAARCQKQEKWCQWGTLPSNMGDCGRGTMQWKNYLKWSDF